MFDQYSVIFDMDGVLADTGPIHFDSWVKMFSEIGYHFNKELFKKTFGVQSPTIVRKLVGDRIEQELVEKWAALKEQYYREMVKDKLKPLPGVKQIIQELKSFGFKLAVGTSAPRENVELLLNKLQLKQHFDVLITAAEVKSGKPSPDVFLISAKKLKVKPKNCLVIEDAPVGIEAAQRAGMKSIALTTTHEKSEFLNADLIVKDLSEVNLKDIMLLLNIVQK
ncbi:MAG: HAD family hydrolase [Candidatus Hermodarchaeota archaeon]